MIPFKDENPTRTFPILTVLIIAANVLVFLRQQTLPHGGAFIFGAVPGHIVFGNNYGVPMLEPGWLTIFTSMFMHGGWLHLGGNMLFLWIFGNNIEELLGRFKFIIFYLVCGVAAAGLQIMMSLSPQAAAVPMVGASGAVAGVLGAYFIKYPTARVRTLIFWFFIQVVVLPAYIVLGLWFIIQFFSAMLNTAAGMSGGGVAFFAHVGGFIAGMVLVNPFIGKFKRTRRISRNWLQ
ncbi:MAG: rhomboid family intramembrane serine protease [Armatimonadetes bacterium]|nr:rhomboid family intramembrane serine protease [Armatimonadota bacterium]NIM22948.1 rhomboid family intramembrane serine protease [Armatimonadota bacterium]NIM66819.1 rhomboid family intramembrane serine protease [Armatimonadota bacterium]NIM75360.1 rhomboid family intramembrane serine protease [Armatimonadota bacterium]NIN05007.1 rhomboid family intramembrane serine protease [Armatimonadota bacterium]